MMSISLVGKRAQWPAICPCCGASTQDTLKSSWTEKRYVGGGTRLHTRSTKVPYCKPCKRHIPLSTANFVVWGAVAFGLGAIPLTINDRNGGPFVILITLLGALLMWGVCAMLNTLRAKRTRAHCVTDKVAVQLSFQRGVDMTTFTFFDDKYADYFARLNADNRTY
jgi:hypothetical protein